MPQPADRGGRHRPRSRPPAVPTSARRDHVARGGLREDDRRELARGARLRVAPRTSPPSPDAAVRRPKCAGTLRCEPGSAPAAVPARMACQSAIPPRSPAAAPVATDRADRRQAEHAALRRDARCSSSRSRRRCPRPSAVGAGAKDGEGVVAQDVLARPIRAARARGRCAGRPPEGRRRRGRTRRGRRRGAARRSSPASRPRGARSPRRSDRGRRRRRSVLVVARGDPGGAQHGPVAAQQRRVDLRTAAVDREQRRRVSRKRLQLVDRTKVAPASRETRRSIVAIASPGPAGPGVQQHDGAVAVGRRARDAVRRRSRGPSASGSQSSSSTCQCTSR